MAKVRTRKRGKTFSYIFKAGQQNGRCKVIEKGGFPTQNAAYVAGVEAFTSWKHGNIGITSERTLLSDFAELWLKHAAKNIRISTVLSYKTILSSRVLPILGNTIIQDLTPAVIESWITGLYIQGYSKGYIKQNRMVLKVMLDHGFTGISTNIQHSNMTMVIGAFLAGCVGTGRYYLSGVLVRHDSLYPYAQDFGAGLRPAERPVIPRRQQYDIDD